MSIMFKRRKHCVTTDNVYSHGLIRVDSLIFYYIYINKSFFTLWSITMKWINLWSENKADYIIFNLILQLLFCTKAKKKNIGKSRKRNMILRCLCPHLACVAL